MAKKQNEATPNVNATANRDIVQRLNFLYQASVYLQSIDPALPTETATRKGKAKQSGDDSTNESNEMATDKDASKSTAIVKHVSGKKHKVGRKKTTGDLARSYVQCMRVVGQKTTVKIDPSLKRSLCSNCSTTLVPGSSATVRVKRSQSHAHILIYTCMHCNATKRIPAPPDSTTSESTIPHLSSSTQPAADRTITSLDAQPVLEGSNISRKRRRKDNRRIHPPPLSARRNAGHVVFRGNERIILDDDAELGLVFT